MKEDFFFVGGGGVDPELILSGFGFYYFVYKISRQNTNMAIMQKKLKQPT